MAKWFDNEMFWMEMCPNTPKNFRFQLTNNIIKGEDYE
jgi:hypothetical protein